MLFKRSLLVSDFDLYIIYGQHEFGDLVQFGSTPMAMVM